MGHDISFVYKDIDNSFEKIKEKTIFKDEEGEYAEVDIDDILMIFTKSGKFVEITTSIKSNEEGRNLQFEEQISFLKSFTASNIFKIDNILLDIWADKQTPNWEESDDKVNEFFNWLEEQDNDYWEEIVNKKV